MSPSLSQIAFSVECFARGWTVTESPNPGRRLVARVREALCIGCSWRLGQVIHLSNDIGLSVQHAQTGYGIRTLSGSETLRSSLVCGGRNLIRVDLVHDQLLVDNRRRGDATYSDQPSRVCDVTEA